MSGIMTWRDEAWNDLFKELNVTDAERRITRAERAERDAAQWRYDNAEGEEERERCRIDLERYGSDIVGELEDALGWYRTIQGPNYWDIEGAIKWHRDTLKCAAKLADLLRKVPEPWEDATLFGYSGDPDNPDSVACEQVSKIVRVLSKHTPEPRPRRRPKADYINLRILVSNIAPIYESRTGRKVAAGNAKGGGASGPFVRVMEALLVLAGEQQPINKNAIRMAVKAYKASMKKSTKR